MRPDEIVKDLDSVQDRGVRPLQTPHHPLPVPDLFVDPLHLVVDPSTELDVPHPLEDSHMEMSLPVVARSYLRRCRPVYLPQVILSISQGFQDGRALDDPDL